MLSILFLAGLAGCVLAVPATLLMTALKKKAGAPLALFALSVLLVLVSGYLAPGHDPFPLQRPTVEYPRSEVSHPYPPDPEVRTQTVAQPGVLRSDPPAGPLPLAADELKEPEETKAAPDPAEPEEEDTQPETAPSQTEKEGSSGNFNTYDNPEQQNTADKWVLNTSSKKIHYPSCNDVKKIADQNYATSNLSEKELTDQGYTLCGHCH